MNLWILSAGPEPLPDSFETHMNVVAGTYATLIKRESVKFSLGNVRYLSLHTSSDLTPKRYHHTDQAGNFYGYCGLAHDRTGKADLGQAENLARAFDSLHQLGEGIFGAFRINKSGYTVLGDPLGGQKIYLYRPSEDQSYLTNDINLLKGLKDRAVNINFFLQRTILGHATGTITDDPDIERIPMYGRVTYAEGKTTIDSTRSVEDITEIKGDWEDWMDRLAEEYRTVAAHVFNTYNVVHGQSGGFDSRLMLLMFDGLDLSAPNFASFTFNSGIGMRDVNLSAQLAKRTGMRHRKVILRPNNVPTLQAFIDNSKKQLTPYRSFDRIHYDNRQPKIADLFAPGLHVYTFGSDGAVEPLTRLCLLDYRGSRMRQSLEWYAKTDLMKPDAAHEFLDAMETSVNARYEGVDTDRSGAMAYIFEMYRADPVELHHKTRDLFPPFYFSGFLELLFLCNNHQRTKRNTGSFYHGLAERLVPGRVPNMEFTEFVKWNATAWDKRWLKFKNRLRDRFVGRTKYELQIKTAMMRNNLPAIKKLVADHADSELFRHFDHNKVMHILDSEQELLQHCGTLCKLIPALPYVDGE